MRRFLLVLLCFILGRFLTRPEVPKSFDVQASKQSPVSIIPTNRDSDVTDWIAEVSEIFAGWETPGSSAAFRTRFHQLEPYGPAAHACTLARLLSEWQVHDGADLLAFALDRPARPAALRDDTVLRWSLQLLFHQEPEVVLPFLHRLVADGGRLSTRWVNTWLMAAGGQDPDRRRALAERYKLLSDEQILTLTHPEAALEEALASGESIDGILIDWARHNPRAAWKAAEEHLDPRNGGHVLEKLFFTWSYANPGEAFEFRQDMAEALVNSNLGEVRNAGYVHHVIGEQIAKRDTPQALTLAQELELGGPFEAFMQGIVDQGQFPGLAGMASVLRKAPTGHWLRGNLLQWIKEHEPSEAALSWASTNLSPADHEALSKLYEPPPEPAPPAAPIDPIAAAQQAWELGDDTGTFLGRFQRWVNTDALTARRWAEDQGDPKLMDTWRWLNISKLMKTAHGDPKEAYELSLEISDPRMRESSVRTAIERWMRDDPIDALKFLEKAPLSDWSRARLQTQAESQAALIKAIRRALPH